VYGFSRGSAVGQQQGEMVWLRVYGRGQAQRRCALPQRCGLVISWIFMRALAFASQSRGYLGAGYELLRAARLVGGGMAQAIHYECARFRPFGVAASPKMRPPLPDAPELGRSSIQASA